MATRYTNKVLLYIILVLLITNIIMLFFFLFPSEKRAKTDVRTRDESGIATLLRDSVGFSEPQVAQYMKLREEERPKLKNYFSRLRETKTRFYKIPEGGENDSLALVMADSIGQIQKQIDLHMRNYFGEIRALCTPEQLPAFDSAIASVVSRMIGRQGRGRPQKDRSENK